MRLPTMEIITTIVIMFTRTLHFKGALLLETRGTIFRTWNPVCIMEVITKINNQIPFCVPDDGRVIIAMLLHS